MIQRANKIVSFFKKSHRAAAILKQKILLHQISRGGLKTYIETSSTISTILRSRGFFNDMQYFSEVLFPIKDAILSVEANRSTLADCYINLMRIAASARNLPVDEYKGFRNYCISKFNQRFEEFNDPTYQLAYFLHPAYKESCETLITQLRIYKEQESKINGNPNPFTASYTIGSDSPLMWWNTCEVKPNHLRYLAIKLFSIIPSSANCDRIFSLLGWIYGNHRTRLDFDRLEGLAKVYRFNLSNPIDQLRHMQITEITPEMMTDIAETVFKEFEESLIKEENTESSNPTEGLYLDEPNLNLNISNFIDLNSSVFTSTNFENYENEELNENESDNNTQKNEYDVDEIFSKQFDDYSC
ncbi:20554_t:CDS:2 [Gigaspora rosea]|nr:20554_t:CDS:2 [Gigaspora rosea]